MAALAGGNRQGEEIIASRVVIAIAFTASLLVACFSLAGPALGQLPLMSAKPAYEVTFLGLRDESLLDLLQRSSLLVQLQEQSTDRDGLRRRFGQDRQRLDKALRSQGYYASKIEYKLVSEPALGVEVRVDTGPSYLLGSFEVLMSGCEGRDCAPAPDEDDLGLSLGDPALSASIAEAERATLTWYREQGHPFPENDPLDVVVDHKLLGVFVQLTVRPGPRQVFGEAVFEGAEGVVSLDYLRRLITWKQGKPYDRRLLREYRARLEASSIFEAVEVAPVRGDGARESVDIRVAVTPGAERSVGTGVRYETDTGPGVSAYWQHRNILGADEDLELRVDVSGLEQQLSGSFRKPAFLQNRQDLVASAALAHEDTDAYESSGLDGQIGLERQVTETLRTGVSVLTEISRVTDQEGERDLYLFGLPVAITNDNRNSALDPTAGWFGSAKATPFTGVFGDELLFAKFEVSASYYYKLPVDGLVFAVRGKVGSIIGEETEAIPATRRFYAGGGGSVRGYEFQGVGPLDGNNDPLGGRSVVEFGPEMRYRLFGDFGIVPFVDAGSVDDDAIPDLSNELRWAAGLGLRYYTGIGPARLDFAIPINKREGVDDDFQFYISLGQAF